MAKFLAHGELRDSGSGGVPRREMTSPHAANPKQRPDLIQSFSTKTLGRMMVLYPLWQCCIQRPFAEREEKKQMGNLGWLLHVEHADEPMLIKCIP